MCLIVSGERSWEFKGIEWFACTIVHLFLIYANLARHFASHIPKLVRNIMTISCHHLLASQSTPRGNYYKPWQLPPKLSD